MTNKILAANIRHYRRLNGHTQETLAIASDLHRTTVWNIEKNQLKSEPHPKTLAKLAQALGITIKTLLEP